jgi:hypothetical protein
MLSGRTMTSLTVDGFVRFARFSIRALSVGGVTAAENVREFVSSATAEFGTSRCSAGIAMVSVLTSIADAPATVFLPMDSTNASEGVSLEIVSVSLVFADDELDVLDEMTGMTSLPSAYAGMTCPRISVIHRTDESQRLYVCM